MNKDTRTHQRSHGAAVRLHLYLHTANLGSVKEKVRTHVLRGECGKPCCVTLLTLYCHPDNHLGFFHTSDVF